MKKSLLLLPIIIAALTGLAHADDAAIQQTLKNWISKTPTFNLHLSLD